METCLAVTAWAILLAVVSMETVIAAFAWMLHLVIELQMEILNAFAYVDAPLLLLALVLYLRMRRQRLLKGKSKMKTPWQKDDWSEKNREESQLWEELFIEGEKAIEAGDEARRQLDEASELPNLDEQQIRRFQDVLSNSSEAVRKGLKGAVGPETFIGVQKNIALIWQTIYDSEKFRLDKINERDEHAWTLSLSLDKLSKSMRHLEQLKKIFALTGERMGFDPNKFISPDDYGEAAAGFITEAARVNIASMVGLDNVEHLRLKSSSAKQLPKPNPSEETEMPDVVVVDEEGEPVSPLPSWLEGMGNGK